jgi:multidrug efflux pump subunit AcrB
LRADLPRQYPGVTFYFLPADIVTQILNFGLPAPVDVQISGNDIQANGEFTDRLFPQMQKIPGLADLRIQQVFDQPKIHVAVDRIKAAQSGFLQRDVATSMLIALSGSAQTTPTFWLNPKNGVSYSLATQAPQYQIQSIGDLQNIPVSGVSQKQPEILNDLASVSRGSGLATVTHYNIRRTLDVYGTTQGRDLGGVGADIRKVVEANRKYLPKGSEIVIRGQVATMQESFTGLLAGLVFAIVLIYLLIVVNFQSWLDPFIIITALPAALAGIVLFLFITRTTLSVPALMGAIMCMGVATANSILVVSFAKEQLQKQGNPIEAALAAGITRFRPVLMTALAMIIGMIPMALGFGDGGEQNAPLGRAVIGGLLLATVATLIFVPAVFSIFHGRRGAVQSVRQ